MMNSTTEMAPMNPVNKRMNAKTVPPAADTTWDQVEPNAPLTIAVMATQDAAITSPAASRPSVLSAPSRTATARLTAPETAVQEGRISHQEAGEYVRFYEEGLNGYTYLVREDDL